MKRFAMLAVAALLAGGAGPARAQPDPIVTAAQGYALRLMEGGLASGRRGLHSYPVFVFGISRSEAIRRVTALRGPALATGTGRACGTGPLAFARFGTLTLFFRADRWVGWALTGPRARRPIDSEWDLGIGTLRAALDGDDRGEPAVRRTPRGFEFEADGIHGLLSGPGPQARVTMLWSGEICRGR